MKLNIRTSGPAGMGINSTAEIILHIASDLGYEVLTDLEYESKIKGGTNYFDVFISDSSVSLSKYVDILIAFDKDALEKNIESLKPGAVVILSKKTISKTELDLSDFNVLDLEITEKFENTYLLGILSKLLNIPLEYVSKQLAHIFGRKGEETVNKNIQIVSEIVKAYELSFDYDIELEKVGDPKEVLYGNKAVAYGAIAGGMDFYSAYPMTPASTILSEVVNSKKVKYLQAEDEIAVINCILGASFTGARSMTASSGGGFALMTEALSFVVQAELPVTVVLSQRAGPSTGTPTYFEQGDLNFALNPTFGDFNHILLCPSNIDEAYYMSGLALNLADRYQGIVLILIDKQVSENFATSAGGFSVPEIDRGKMEEYPAPDYKRYELTFDHISPRVDVGTKNGDFIATSYEHDEYGATTEDSEMKIKMTEKRVKKYDDFYEKEAVSGYEIINPEAKKMIVTMGFTSYTAKEFVKNNEEYGLVVIKYLKPLDERLLDDLKDKHEVIFAESNYSGQLENYITKELGLKFIEGLNIKNIRKYDLYPFYYEDFETLLN